MRSQKSCGLPLAVFLRHSPVVSARRINIVLIGFMGSGKSSIGRIVAGRMGFQLIDTDALVVQRAGREIPAIFAEHGINIAAVFDSSPNIIGGDIGGATVLDERRLKDVVRDKNIVVGVLAVPAGAAQKVADDLVDAGVRIIFNYSEALLDVPSDVTVHTSNPAVELLHALYFHLT